MSRSSGALSLPRPTWEGLTPRRSTSARQICRQFKCPKKQLRFSLLIYICLNFRSPSSTAPPSRGWQPCYADSHQDTWRRQSQSKPNFISLISRKKYVYFQIRGRHRLVRGHLPGGGRLRLLRRVLQPGPRHLAQVRLQGAHQRGTRHCKCCFNFLFKKSGK